MEIIRVSRIADFGGANRKYYDMGDIRILDVHHHPGQLDESWHFHNEITETLFIIEGKIQVKLKEKGKITEVIVNPNEIIKFSPKEVHQVTPLTTITRILVVKYISKNEMLIPVIAHDWQDFST